MDQTTSQVILPNKLIGKTKIPHLRIELIKAIGEKKACVGFRGLTFMPTPAYEEVHSTTSDAGQLSL